MTFSPEHRARYAKFVQVLDEKGRATSLINSIFDDPHRLHRERSMGIMAEASPAPQTADVEVSPPVVAVEQEPELDNDDDNE